jgi:hypothetical protein
MSKYSNTVIYKLCCKDPLITDIYIGSTINLHIRKQQHKNRYNNANSKEYKKYVYEFIRNNGGWANWDMIEIIKICCINKLDAERIERQYIETMKANLNKQMPYSGTETNEGMKEYQKKYYVENIDKMKEYQKNYYVENIDKISKRQKEYNSINADKKRIYDKEYKLKKKLNKKVEDKTGTVLIDNDNEQ